MRARRHNYLVAYDIPDDARRLKVARLLERYCERKQYSVFMCWLYSRQLERLKEELLKLTIAEEDNLLIYKVDGDPELILGTAMPTPKENYVI